MYVYMYVYIYISVRIHLFAYRSGHQGWRDRSPVAGELSATRSRCLTLPPAHSDEIPTTSVQMVGIQLHQELAGNSSMSRIVSGSGTMCVSPGQSRSPNSVYCLLPARNSGLHAGARGALKHQEESRARHVHHVSADAWREPHKDLL